MHKTCLKIKSILHFRGSIKAGLCRTLLQIKIRQKLRSPGSQAELLGKKFWLIWLTCNRIISNNTQQTQHVIL